MAGSAKSAPRSLPTPAELVVARDRGQVLCDTLHSEQVKQMTLDHFNAFCAAYSFNAETLFVWRTNSYNASSYGFFVVYRSRDDKLGLSHVDREVLMAEFNASGWTLSITDGGIPMPDAGRRGDLL